MLPMLPGAVRKDDVPAFKNANARLSITYFVCRISTHPWKFVPLNAACASLLLLNVNVYRLLAYPGALGFKFAPISTMIVPSPQNRFVAP